MITALDIWGVIWLVGDYHAFRIRPLLVTEQNVELRFGFRWSATIPRAAIATVEELAPDAAERLRGDRSYLRLSILDEPDHVIRLREPVTVIGMAGMRRDVTAVGIRVDDPTVIEALASSARERVDSSGF